MDSGRPDPVAVERAREALEERFARSLPVVEVTPVHVGEVDARVDGRNLAAALGGRDALYRLVTEPPAAMDVLETRDDVAGFLRREVAGEDLEVVATAYPPEHVGGPLSFYVRSRV